MLWPSFVVSRILTIATLVTDGCPNVY